MPLDNREIRKGEFWADKLMDLANLSVVVLVFGQFVTNKITWPAVLMGIGLYILAVVLSLFLRR